MTDTPSTYTLESLVADGGITQAAVDNLKQVIDTANEIFPFDGIMLTADHDVAVFWARSWAYADIECAKDGSIRVMLMRGKKLIDNWKVTDVREAVERVKAHLYGLKRPQQQQQQSGGNN